MERLFFKSLVGFLMLVVVASPAQGQDPELQTRPWVKAAIAGIASMNRGDGKTFAKVAHPEHMGHLKGFMATRLKADPNRARVQSMLRAYGVSTVEEYEKLPANKVMEVMIPGMFAANPKPCQDALRTAKFHAIETFTRGVYIAFTWSRRWS